MASGNIIEVTLTTDVAYIDSVFAALHPLISNDQFPEPISVAAVVARPEFKFLKVTVDGTPSGLVMLVEDEVHTAFLPNLRGRPAMRAGHAVLDWIRANTSFRSIRSYAYSNRPEVALFARLMGFTPTRTYGDGTTINGAHVLRTDFIKEI